MRPKAICPWKVHWRALMLHLSICIQTRQDPLRPPTTLYTLEWILLCKWMETLINKQSAFFCIPRTRLMQSGRFTPITLLTQLLLLAPLLLLTVDKQWKSNEQVLFLVLWFRLDVVEMCPHDPRSIGGENCSSVDAAQQPMLQTWYCRTDWSLLCSWLPVESPVAGGVTEMQFPLSKRQNFIYAIKL